MCSASGYYAWLRRPPSAREQADRALRDQIVDIHSRSRGTYGAPRIHAELAAEGVAVGRKRVARLMRQARIQGVHRRRKVATTRQNPERLAAPDLVRREFTATGPNHLWVADITYIPTKAGFLYLAAVIDVWSRRAVGWSMRNDLTTPLVTDALDMALAQRKPDQLIHHSDRGSQGGFNWWSQHLRVKEVCDESKEGSSVGSCVEACDAVAWSTPGLAA